MDPRTQRCLQLRPRKETDQRVSSRDDQARSYASRSQARTSASNSSGAARRIRWVHIPVVASKSHDEFKGIVVEMIPQNRPPGWTLAKLRAVQRLRRHVLIAGALFFDNIHVVNRDPATPISNQPRRVSVWELHPVSHFFVCNKTNSKCNTNNLAEWTPLEDFVEP